MLSGDSAQTVEAIAHRTGVDEKYGHLLPEDKVRVIGELEQRYGAVAMLGDGINDAGVARVGHSRWAASAATRPWRAPTWC